MIASITGFAQAAEAKIPQPDKKYNGGADACFISKDKVVLGVFDGK